MLQGNFFTIVSLSREAGGLKAVLELNPGHAIFAGHFPGSPVVPGVCMMQIVKEMVEDVAGKETTLVRADHMKFLAVINPQENKVIQLELSYTRGDDKQIRVMASLLNNGITYFKFKGVFS